MDPKALRSLTYGLHIVTAKSGDRLNGQVANTVIQVSSDPRMVAVAINRKNLTYEFIKESGRFAVSVLSKQAPLSLIGDFGFKSGREVDKFAGRSYRLTPSGLPILPESSVAYLEVVVTGSLEAGTHTIFVGEVVEAESLAEGEPMTYAYYQAVKQGATPETAPVREVVKPTGPGPKYRCSICGYLYDPAVGDPQAEIPAGTPFEALPEDWTCPLCGASKADFVREE
ncbi:MAG: flavin reductase [Moorellales bacterium]